MRMGSVYAGPIGAILTPQLLHMHQMQSLPYASSLCGACYEVCPVKINIPEVLIHLRAKVVDQQQHTIKGTLDPMNLGMKMMAGIFASDRRLRAAQRLARIRPVAGCPTAKASITTLPGMLGGWTQVRDLMPVPRQSFREWWDERNR